MRWSGREQVGRLALQHRGNVLEAFDRDARAAMLIGLDEPDGDPDRPGELALGQTTRLAELSNPGAHTAVDGALSLHGATSCP